MRILILLPSALAFTLLLSGCVSPTLYNWGGYDQALYASYKDATKTDELRLKLETHIAAMEKSNQKVAPGLYAELGTLYLQSGASEKASGFYAKERDFWPESKGLMTSMIQNIERRGLAKTEGSK